MDNDIDNSSYEEENDFRSILDNLYDEHGGTEDDAQDSGEDPAEQTDSTENSASATDGKQDVVADSGDTSGSGQTTNVELSPEIASRIADLEVEESISRQFKESLSPHMEFIQEFGINPYAHINDLMSVSKTLTTGSVEEKAGMIATLCDMFGVDFEALDSALADIVNRPAPDKIDYVVSKLDALEQRISQPAPTQQQNVGTDVNTNDLQKEISDFALKNEHFNLVQNDMGLFLQTGRAKNLEEAYKLACSINDKVKSIEAAKSEKATKAAVAGTKTLKKSSSPVSTPSGGKQDLRSMLDSLYDDMDQ